MPSWGDYRNGSDSDSDTPSTQPLSDAAHPLSDATAALLRGAPSGGRGGAAAQHVGPESPEERVRLAAEAMGQLAAGGSAFHSAYSAEGGFQDIPPHELHERLATGQVSLLLDVRSTAEYDACHITGAVSVPLDTLSERVRAGDLDAFRDRPVVAVCAAGSRSAQAAVRLSKVFGFANVANAAGGMRGWKEEGLPVQEVREQGGAGLGAGGGGCGCGGAGGGGGCKNGK